MHPADLNLAFARTLADSLATLGLRHVCISPGSRNTPLIVAFAEHPTIEDWSHHDERNGSFFAVGLARVTDAPVALVCTSGTASAEYLPAIVEARHARVPLLVLTADRPSELRDVGAPQAIDQLKMYGDAVKWFHQSGPPDPTLVPTAPALAAHAWGEACEAPAGPVHLNLSFRDPLTPPPGHRDDVAAPPPPRVVAGDRRPSPTVVADLAAVLSGRRNLFVVGAVPFDAADAIDDLAMHTEAVVIADPLSGLRSGARRSAIVAGDLLAAAGALDRHRPQAVVRWGALPTSKPLWRWLEDHSDVPQVLVDGTGHRDPLSSASVVVRADAAATAADLKGVLQPADAQWPRVWRDLDTEAGIAVDGVLATERFPNEPAVARTVAAATPAHAVLFVGSSMPIRDVDSFAERRDTPITIIANRGASGIDGTVSTALGATAGSSGPGVALVGDVAALHDLGALADIARLALPLTVVVVHNDGGGIFGLLDQADSRRLDPTIYRRHMATPHGVDFVAVATALGIRARRITDADELRQAVAGAEGPQLVEVRTKRSDVAPLRRRIGEAVASAIGT